MKGRKHLRLVDKKMRGTARPCRINRNAPAPQNEPPGTPAELSKRATGIFGTLVGRLESMRLASATDTELLALLAASGVRARHGEHPGDRVDLREDRDH